MLARKKASKLAKKEERVAFWLLAPSLLLLLIIAIYPLGRVIQLSFTDKRFASDKKVHYIGGKNYGNLLSMTIRELPLKRDDQGKIIKKDGKAVYESWVRVLPRKPKRYRAVYEFMLFGKKYVFGAVNADFVRAVIDTINFTVITVILETLLGLVVALALSRRFLGRGLMRTAMLVPWAIITVVSSLIWGWMLKSDRSGFFNALFNRLGLSDGNTVFLVDKHLQLPSIIAIDVWKTTPFMALLLLAGLATIPRELYEAAEVDGANKIRQFFAITLPLLMPTLTVALIFRTLDALRVFDLFQVIFGEKRYSMATFTQFALVANKDMGLSSAASVIIFVIIFLFAMFYIRALRVDTDV